MAPESYVIDYEMLSPMSKSLLNESNGAISKSYKSKKLTATFLPKKNYVVHYRNLQFYLKNGMKLDCVHKVLSFRQSKFALPFINLMTTRRKNAKTKLQETIAKNISNIIYGNKF